MGVGGSGSGVGVGGWQLYEHVINPTLDTQLSKENLKYSPVRVPLSETPPTQANKKYTWNSWGCVKKLFPTIHSSIKHEEINAPNIKAEPQYLVPVDNWQDPSKKIEIPFYFVSSETYTDDVVSCSLFDWRGGDDASSEKIYFRSEVAVKDKDYGWVMWNGLSSNPSQTQKNVDFEYRLLTFIKDKDGTWKIDRGYGWSTPASTEKTNNQLHVAIPKGHKLINTKQHVGDYSQRRIWSGIAKVDKSSGEHLIKSLEIYMRPKGSTNTDDKYKAEFFGLHGGKWNRQDAGYTQANRVYVEGKGWQKLSQTVNLSTTLQVWYSELMKKKIKWITCDQWSGERKSGSNMSLADQSIKDICYSRAS